MDLHTEVDTVLFVVVDSLRFDAHPPALPVVNELANENADFTSFYAPGASTPSSMPGFFQSRSLINHRGYGLELPPEIPTLPEHLAASGIKCRGWHSNTYVGEESDSNADSTDTTILVTAMAEATMLKPLLPRCGRW